MFGTKSSSHPLFPIPRVLTCGKREAVVIKDSCRFFHFKSPWRHCNHTDSWKQHFKASMLFELVGSALLKDDGLCFRLRGTRQCWTVVCVRNTSPGRVASRIANRETSTCSKLRFHFFFKYQNRIILMMSGPLIVSLHAFSCSICASVIEKWNSVSVFGIQLFLVFNVKHTALPEKFDSTVYMSALSY